MENEGGRSETRLVEEGNHEGRQTGSKAAAGGVVVADFGLAGDASSGANGSGKGSSSGVAEEEAETLEELASQWQDFSIAKGIEDGEEFTMPWTDFGRLKSFEDGVVVKDFGAAVGATTGVVVELASRWEGLATPKGIRDGETMVVVELVEPGGRDGVVLAYCLAGRGTCEVVDPGGPVGGVPRMKDGGEVQKWEVREVTQEGGLEHDNMNKKKRGASEVPEGVKADGVGGEFPDPIMG